MTKERYLSLFKWYDQITVRTKKVESIIELSCRDDDSATPG